MKYIIDSVEKTQEQFHIVVKLLTHHCIQRRIVLGVCLQKSSTAERG